MKSFKNKVLLGLMVLPLFILPSCVDEPDCSLNNEKLVDVKLTITLPEPISKSVTTKAPRTDYNTVNDLNVLIFNASGNLIGSYYFNEGDGGDPPQSTVFPTLPLNSSTLSTDITFYGVDPAYDKFYLVGNYGGPIPTSVTTVGQLKNLKQIEATGIPTKCMMFAEAASNGGSGMFTYLKADLVRTLAMVTVKIEALADFRSDIRITPTKIRLLNVPNSCVLGNNLDNIDDLDNAIGANSVTAVPTGDAAITTTWGTLTSTNTVLGGHESTAIPLFMFENKQGNKMTDTEQNKKISDKPNSSYLEVEASYQYLVGTTVNKSGTIIYRFSLGSDITTNFDVIRNHHYAVTLQLSGWGGAFEDGHVNSSGVLVIDGDAAGVSWRVDLALRDWGFLQDEFNFDAHASSGTIPVAGNGWNLEWVSGDVWLRFLQNGNGSWKDPKTSANFDNTGGLLKFYVVPWRFTDADYGTPYREFVLRVRKGPEYQIVTFRQWSPIRLEPGLYMERFEEAGNMITWGYNGDVLAGTFGTGNYSFLFGGNEAIGWNNTLYLYSRNATGSPAAQLCMKKAGYDFTGVPGNAPIIPAERAAYFMPAKTELVKLVGYVGDIYDPEQFHDPVVTAEDYWSSSASDPDRTYTYFWQGVTTMPTPPIIITSTTVNRNLNKRVRCTYRPALNP